MAKFSSLSCPTHLARKWSIQHRIIAPATIFPAYTIALLMPAAPHHGSSRSITYRLCILQALIGRLGHFRALSRDRCRIDNKHAVSPVMTRRSRDA